MNMIHKILIRLNQCWLQE